jgi:hypothetical protein
MRRAFATFVLLLSACAQGHKTGESIDSSTIDTSASDIDSPPGTIDSPSGTIDSPPGTIDSPPGTPDSPPSIDAPPGTPDAPPADAAPDANNCTTQPCTLAPQCGCPTGQSCDVNPTTLMGNVCRAVNTPGRETNTCGSFSECDVGYVCIGDGTNDNCHKYCTSNADCASPRGQCVIQLTDNSTPPKAIPGAVTCSSDCDPSTANASAYCPASWKCGLFSATYPTGSTTTYDIADCEIAGTGTEGASCQNGSAGDDTKCAANYTCATKNGTTFTCGKVVKYLTGSCPGGTSLYEFNPALTIGGTEYGVCM